MTAAVQAWACDSDHGAVSTPNRYYSCMQENLGHPAFSHPRESCLLPSSEVRLFLSILLSSVLSKISDEKRYVCSLKKKLRNIDMAEGKNKILWNPLTQNFFSGCVCVCLQLYTLFGEVCPKRRERETEWLK